MISTKSLKTLLAAGALALVAGATSAATYNPCAASTAGKVSNTTGCQILVGEDQDFLNTNPLTVNTPPGFFLEEKWKFIGKVGTDGFLTGSAANGESGSFSLASVVADLGGKVLILFKGGSNDIIGYLVGDLMATINWSTPFTDPPFNLPGGSTSQNVSHISVYTVPAAVPLPAAGFLLIGALGGLAALRRRRSA